jgi:hypothetical protein
MKRLFSVTVVLSLMAFGLNVVLAFQKGSRESASDSITEITFEYQAGCWGDGLAYKVILRKDGTATYNGVGFMRLKGKYIGEIKEDDFQRLADLLADYGFFEMEELYGNEIRHLRGITISAVRNKQRKTVEEHLQEGPPKLGAIERMIDRALAKIGWVADTR